MREDLKKYKVAIQCHCNQKLIVEADDLADLLSNIQHNIISHIKTDHPQDMEKFKSKLKQSIFETFNKMFDNSSDLFEGEEGEGWKL